MDRWIAAHRVAVGLMAALPKTSETTDLVRRTVMREKDKAVAREDEVEKESRARQQLEDFTSQGRAHTPPDAARARAEKDFDTMRALEKSPWYIVGTSLTFEAAVLALACWMFSRRDY